jgi:hypothetical protein
VHVLQAGRFAAEAGAVINDFENYLTRERINDGHGTAGILYYSPSRSRCARAAEYGEIAESTTEATLATSESAASSAIVR